MIYTFQLLIWCITPYIDYRDDLLCKAWTRDDLYTVHREEFSITCYMCDTYI
jgi:hypothetical protein